MCKTECSACSSDTSCSSCIIGYALSGATCVANCGNGKREDKEECDDGNIYSGDGCSFDCRV